MRDVKNSIAALLAMQLHADVKFCIGAPLNTVKPFPEAMRDGKRGFTIWIMMLMMDQKS